MKKKLLFLAAAAALFVVNIHSASAATYTWGAGTDGFWSTAGSWYNTTTGTTGTPGSADTVSINNATPGYTITLNSAATVSSLGLGTSATTGMAGTLNVVSGADLRITNAISLGAGTVNTTGTINQSGGSVIAGSMTTGASSGSRQGFYNLTGGTLTLTGSMLLGSQGNGTFTQSAGAVTVGGNLILVGNVNGAGAVNVTSASYVISGGALTVSGNLYNGLFGTLTTSSTGTGTGRSILTVAGSSAVINVAGSYATGTQSSTRQSSLNVQIDNGGLSKINLTGTGTANVAGTFSSAIKGGVALTSTTSFTVIEANTGNISGTFDHVVGSSLWNASGPSIQAVSGTRDGLNVSYSSSAKLGDLVADSENLISLSFTSTAAGYAGITNVGNGVDLFVYLNANAGTGKTITELLTYFTSNGITAEVSDLGGYTIKLSYDDVGATSYFAFDLASFNATANISEIGVAVAVPEPSTWVLLACGVIGLLVVSKRRRNYCE